MSQTLKILNACIDIIKKEQDLDGGFSHGKYKTTYITALVLQALTICKEKSVQKKIDTISDKCTSFLLSEKNDKWTWNYFSKETQKQFPTLHYPNDNDDTFIVLSALLLKNKDIFTGEVLATIIKNLTSSESSPGGPYRTWLTQTEDASWQDVDVVVNANIAYFLHLQNIHLSNLDTFLINALEHNLIQSPYYPSVLPLLYFLSKSNLNAEESIIKKIRKFRNQEGSKNSLMLDALCLSSLIRLGIKGKEIKILKEKIFFRIKKEGIESEPFCIDPQIDGVTHFCGSKSLTASFIVEALSLYEESIIHLKKDMLVGKIVKRAENIFPKHIIQKAMGNLDKEFILYPLVLKSKLRSVSITEIDQTSEEISYLNLLGWIAYKIIDDIMDENKYKEYLPLVPIALREIDIAYIKILNQDDYQNLYKSLMDTMDRAQKEEQNNVTTNEEEVLKRLGEKSLGHALPTIVLISLLNERAFSSAITSIISFWKNYLTAKQLSDDAHDWKEDLRNRVSNSTLFFIRQSKYFQKEKSQDESHLEEIFWNETIMIISEKIQSYATSAFWNIKEHRCFKDTKFFSFLIFKIKNDAENALKERRKIMDFYEQIS